MIFVLIAFGLALTSALLVIPLVARLAKRFGLVDHPDKLRKLHPDSIPMVGGVTLIILVPLVTLILIYLGVEYRAHFQEGNRWLNEKLSLSPFASDLRIGAQDIKELSGLLLASLILLVVGLIDDRFGIRGRQKLLGQFISATVLIVSGYQFDHVMLFGHRIELGVLSGLIIYLWVITAVNSVNLLDGADGIAGTIGLIMSLAIGAMAVYMGKIVDGVIACAIAGVLLGFLRFNFPPAKAYLGDAGSMLIGLLLSSLAIRCMFKFQTAYAFLAPLALLAIPFIDTAAAIIRRRLTGRSIFAVDRGHLHHSLLKRGYSPRVSVLWVAMLTMTTAAGAVLSLIFRRPEFAVLSIGIVLVVMITCRIFGFAEYQLVTRRAHAFARSFFRFNPVMPDIMQGSVHVQGHRNWKEVWRLLYEFAEENQLIKLTLDINAPWLHESFHATRNLGSTGKRIEGGEWFAVLPLVVSGRSFGRVEVTGQIGQLANQHRVVRSLLGVLDEIESALNELDNRSSSQNLEDQVASSSLDEQLAEKAAIKS